MIVVLTPTTKMAIAVFTFIFCLKKDKRRKGVKVAPSTAHAKTTVEKTLLEPYIAIAKINIETKKVAILFAFISCFFGINFENKSLDKAEEHTSTCESAVEMVEENKPAKMSPKKKSEKLSFENRSNASS